MHQSTQNYCLKIFNENNKSKDCIGLKPDNYCMTALLKVCKLHSKLMYLASERLKLSIAKNIKGKGKFQTTLSNLVELEKL